MPIGKAETWKDRGGVTRTRPRRPGPRRQGAYTPPHSGFRLQTCDLFGRLGVRPLRLTQPGPSAHPCACPPRPVRGRKALVFGWRGYRTQYQPTQTPSAKAQTTPPASWSRARHTTASRPCQYSSRRALAVCHGSGATTCTPPIVSGRLAARLSSIPSHLAAPNWAGATSGRPAPARSCCARVRT